MKVVSLETAVGLIHDADTVAIGGSGGGHAVPEALIVALEQRFLAEKAPRGISIFHPVGLGDEESLGVGRLGASRPAEARGDGHAGGLPAPRSPGP